MAKAGRFLSGEDFKVWRCSRKMTLQEVGNLLGVTLQAVRHLEQEGISKAQALALAAIDGGKEPWTPTPEERERAAKFEPRRGRPMTNLEKKKLRDAESST